MSEGTFEERESEGLATGAGPTESGDTQQYQGGGTAQGDSDIQGDIEGKAEEAKVSSDDPHLGDAMDDVDLEPKSS
jgi:hypothetical protein